MILSNIKKEIYIYVTVHSIQMNMTTCIENSLIQNNQIRPYFGLTSEDSPGHSLQMLLPFWVVIGDLPHVVVFDGHENLQHVPDVGGGLVPTPQGLGRGLDLHDRVLQTTRVILPQGEAHIW